MSRLYGTEDDGASAHLFPSVHNSAVVRGIVAEGCVSGEPVDFILLRATLRTWIGSVQGAVAAWSNHGSQESLEYRMLI